MPTVGRCGSAPVAVRAVGRHRCRRREALAGEQDGVGQETGQLAQVVPAALDQVRKRLGGHSGRHGGLRHQFRVRRGLAAEADQRQAAAAQLRDAGLPGAQAAEQPDHDEVHAGQQGRQIG